MPKLTALAAGAAVLALGLAACGSSSSSSSSTSSSAAPASSSATASTSTSAAAPASGATLQVAADPGGALKFDMQSLSATAGKVTITFANASSTPHNLTLEQGSGGSQLGATPTFSGGSKTLTLTLKPGTYTFFCSVPGHRAAGMQGTLTVK